MITIRPGSQLETKSASVDRLFHPLLFRSRITRSEWSLGEKLVLLKVLRTCSCQWYEKMWHGLNSLFKLLFSSYMMESCFRIRRSWVRIPAGKKIFVFLVRDSSGSESILKTVDPLRPVEKHSNLTSWGVHCKSNVNGRARSNCYWSTTTRTNTDNEWQNRLVKNY